MLNTGNQKQGTTGTWPKALALLALSIASSAAYTAPGQASAQTAPPPTSTTTGGTQAAGAGLSPSQALARSHGMRAMRLGDHSRAIDLLRPVAEAGDAATQNAIGEMLIAGKDARVVRADAEAASWFRKAAIQGLSPAQVNLGLMLEAGTGVAQSEEEAARWFRRAALDGFAGGQHHLARFYQTGKGLPLDLDQAVFWYAKAVKQNFAPALAAFGQLHLDGIGVTRDPVEGRRLLQRAADQGFVDAQRALDELQSAGSRP